MQRTKTETALTYTEYERYGRAPTVHQILVIEYHRNVPFSVITDHGQFDFDFCNRDNTLYYCMSGSGAYGDRPSHGINGFSNPSPPPGKIWTAPGVTLHRWESTERPKVPVHDDAALLAMGMVRIQKPLLLKTWDGKTRNPFDAGEDNSGHLEYCSICDDHMPDDNLCDHLEYSEGACEVIGAGGDTPNQEDVFLALDWLAALDRKEWADWQFDKYPDAVRALESLLIANALPPRCSVGRRVLRLAGDADQCDDMEAGFAWFKTLGKDTKEANAQTLAWILTWRVTRAERAKAAERKRLIAELQACAATAEIGRAILAELGIPGGKKADLDAVPVERMRAVLESRRIEAK